MSIFDTKVEIDLHGPAGGKANALVAKITAGSKEDHKQASVAANFCAVAWRRLFAICFRSALLPASVSNRAEAEEQRRTGNLPETAGQGAKLWCLEDAVNHFMGPARS